jgi:hypothetical protein
MVLVVIPAWLIPWGIGILTFALSPPEAGRRANPLPVCSTLDYKKIAKSTTKNRPFGLQTKIFDADIMAI